MPEAGPRRIQLLCEALDLPPTAREAFIVQACGADGALLAELRDLLALDAATAQALDRPADELAADLLAAAEDHSSRLRAGLQVGPWRLIRELGRGGMGAVWLAERADGQYQQRVALKLIRLGMDSEHILREFRRERALLARLQHPNIAQLIDGGIDERGRPWFAMDYIDGVHLGTWLQRQPPLRARLELFAKLCHAVAHAHRQLIIHRDLKPSNVLVEANGEPRLLDFGIARLLESDIDEQTVTVQRFLTRDFAAPELLRGDAAGTSADVYALGLILFELLTCQRYRNVHKASEVTLRPSAAVDAHGTTTAGLVGRGQLRGDLDAITTRALADDPARRYGDAQQLADDVQRHLAGQPVLARPDHVGYRAAKFFQRNRAAVTVGALGLAALILASGIAVRQAVLKGAEAERARGALRQAEMVRDFTTSILAEADPSAARGPQTTVGEVLAAARRRIATELAGEPEVAAQLLDQIGNTYVSLGEDELARTTLAQARDLNARARVPSLAIAASTGGRLAFYDYQDGHAEAALRQLDALIASLRAAPNIDLDIQAQLGKMLQFRGNILWASGRKQAALASNLGAIEAWRHVRNVQPSEFLYGLIGLSDLESALGEGAAALAHADEALADPLLQGAAAPPALVIQARAVRARALQALGRHDDAEQPLREAVAAFGTQYGADGAMTRYWRFRLAESLLALGRLDEAQTSTDTLLALPPDGTAAYRRVRVEVLAATIAEARGATDAAQRSAAAQASACGPDGNAELCEAAHSLGEGGIVQPSAARK